MGKRGVRARGIVLGSAAMVLALLSGCGPAQYYEGTGLHDATAGEVAGEWRCVEETRLTLREDGTAVIQRLDGQDFAFDDGWRLSGEGTWKLKDEWGGQHVRLTLTNRTRVDVRPSAGTDVDAGADVGTGGETGTDAGTGGEVGSSADAAPTTYSWDFYVDRDARKKLVLFFFFGDPDSGSSYVMQRFGAPSAVVTPPGTATLPGTATPPGTATSAGTAAPAGSGGGGSHQAGGRD
ncbi:hypothetical protein [Streptomyces sp. MMS24-I29]|uniref:hypothetical protein n=1 Tax=Streptomyces sp. MMS24-I29 TaxID=3351480 RepID=UPI003C79FBD4